MKRAIGCELSKFGERPIVGKGRARIWPKCERPVYFRWHLRGEANGGAEMLLCQGCGKLLAGNLTDELKRFPK